MGHHFAPRVRLAGYWPKQILAAVGNWAIGAGAIGGVVPAFSNRLPIPLGLQLTPRASHCQVRSSLM